MQILGRTQPLVKYPVLQALEVIRALGFDGVEICLENNDMAPNTLVPETIAAVRQRVTELGLKPYSISYHVDYLYNDANFEMSKAAIRMTPEFGTNLFVFSGPPRRAGDAVEFSGMVERTRVLAAIAESNGVIMAEEFEPNFVVGTTQQLLQLFEEVDSPALAANMDLGHVFLCDPDPVAAILDVGDRIVHCHIEGMATGVHDHMLPQEGDMDLRAYLQALKHVGFDGPLSLDLYRHDYEAVAPGSIGYIRGLLAEIV